MSSRIIRKPLGQGRPQDAPVGGDHDDGVAHAEEGHHGHDDLGGVGHDLGENGPEGGEEEEGDGQA